MKLPCTTALALMTAMLPARAEDYHPIDLDNHAPLERVYADQIDGKPGFRVLAWNWERAEWLDVLHGVGAPDDVEVAKMRPGEPAFATLRYGGRGWVWETPSYIPKPRELKAEWSQLDPELAAAVSKVGDAPASGRVAIATYAEPDGEKVSLAILDTDSYYCAMGGALCPAVLIRDGKPTINVGVHIGHGWSVSDRPNSAGHRLLEKGRADGVMLQDPDTGAIVGTIDAIEIEVSPLQPPAPEDAPKGDE